MACNGSDSSGGSNSGGVVNDPLEIPNMIFLGTFDSNLGSDLDSEYKKLKLANVNSEKQISIISEYNESHLIINAGLVNDLGTWTMIGKSLTVNDIRYTFTEANLMPVICNPSGHPSSRFNSKFYSNEGAFIELYSSTNLWGDINGGVTQNICRVSYTIRIDGVETSYWFDINYNDNSPHRLGTSVTVNSIKYDNVL